MAVSETKEKLQTIMSRTCRDCEANGLDKVVENACDKCQLLKAMNDASKALDLLEKQEQGLITIYDSQEVKNSVDEAIELYNKRESGLIIELPVPIGSEWFYIARDRRRGIKRVKVCGVWTSCKADCSHMHIADVEGTFSTQCEFGEIGIRLFAAREEAEAKLKELRGECNNCFNDKGGCEAEVEGVCRRELRGKE